MTGAATDEFLRAFEAAAETGSALETIAADADGFASALSDRPGAVLRVMQVAADRAGGAASVPRAIFATAALSRGGRLVAADRTFAALDLPERALREAANAALGEAPRLSSIIDDKSGRPVAVVVAGPDRALGWPLAGEVREALTSGLAAYGVLGVGAAEQVDWATLFSPWTLSRAEARLAAALVRRGNLREAARDASVTYETARETLASAMARIGARRQPEFVRQLALLAFGELPASDDVWRTLADAYDLSPRQGRVALLVAMGATRALTAQTLRISDHGVKSDLKVIHERCGVRNGAELGRIVAETEALSRLAAATDVEILTRGEIATPLRFVRRRRGPGRIAVEDHGPPDGAPVVIFHAPINGRHLPRRLVRALLARKLRPISVERPGFGLTSPSQGDLVADANADLIDVLDALGVERVRLLGRSVIMPMSFAAAHPDRVVSSLLLAAIPPGVRARDGLMGTVTAMALDHPGFVAGFARLMVRLSSEASIMSLTERTVRNAPSDLAAIADLENRADWIRACRQSSSGDGFSREFALHAGDGAIPAGSLRTPLTVLFGDQDTMGAGVGDAVALWRKAAPGARCIRLAQAGRLLHLSHAEAVADNLV